MSKTLKSSLDSGFEPDSVPSLRFKPNDGSIIRMPLSDGCYAYALVVCSVRIWVYDFLTVTPAFGDAFFPLSRLRHAICLGDSPASFVTCGRVSISAVNELPEPKWYTVIREDELELYGFKSKYVTYEGRGMMDAREITKEDINRDGLHLHTWLEWYNFEQLIFRWRAGMEIREVPKEFIDHEAMRKMAAGEPVEEKPLPQPRKVEFLIVFQDADGRSDDPELDYEEPLEEALDNSSAGEVAGSGTAPGVFEINVETISSDRARCLGVIRRVLKKAKAPASTVIKELCAPPIEHPLEAPPPVKKKKRR